MTNQQEDFTTEAQVGRILHFVIEHYGRPKCRPAVVVEDWPDQGKPGYVNLVVFPDGSNDGPYGLDLHRHNLGAEHSPEFTAIANNSLLTRWETSVLPNLAVKAVGSWHWPRLCTGLSQPMETHVTEHGERLHHNHTEGVTDPRNCYACARIEASNKQND